MGELNAGIDFLEFKPSEIAAAVAIFVAEENIQAIDIEKAMSGLILIEKVLFVVPTRKKKYKNLLQTNLFLCLLAF